jgi:hypothetical protein
MHQHRTDERHTSENAPTRHRVRGLGICDVLEVELDRGQVEGLIAEIDDLCIALEQSISELVSTDPQSASPAHGDNEETVRRHLHQIAVARAIRGQLVTGDSGRKTVFGPARSLSQLIDGVTRSAVEALAEVLWDEQIAGTSGTARAADLTATVEAWMTTMIEVRELEWFVFDPDEGTGRPA